MRGIFSGRGGSGKEPFIKDVVRINGGRGVGPKADKVREVT